MKPSEALDLVAALRDAFPSSKFPPGSQKIYAQSLLDLELEHAVAAIVSLIAEADWLPPIAQIRARVVACSGAVPDLGWDEAWSQVARDVQRFGLNRPPSYDDPRTAAAVSAISWRELCLGNERERGTIRAQFRQVFENAAARATREAVAPPQLSGDSVLGLLTGKVKE